MRQELEEKIFCSILIRPKLLEEINFNSVYFKNDKFLNLLKKIYQSYNGLDVSIITSLSKDKGKASEFIANVLTQEVTSANVFAYYKRLRELYFEETVMEYANKLSSQEIGYQEFNQKINELNNLDFDSQEILNPNDITINVEVEREYTNIKELDYLLKGVEYGKLTLWSGITNAGKTSLMTQFAKECLKQHKKIPFGSCCTAILHAKLLQIFRRFGLCALHTMEHGSEKGGIQLRKKCSFPRSVRNARGVHAVTSNAPGDPPRHTPDR